MMPLCKVGKIIYNENYNHCILLTEYFYLHLVDYIKSLLIFWLCNKLDSMKIKNK